MNTTLSKQLRMLRGQKRMTQLDVAEAIGVERMLISRWELSKDYPSETEIEKLCRLFSVPREFLIGERSETTDPAERDIIDRVKQLAPHNKRRALQFVADLLTVQEGERKLATQELPVQKEANKITGKIRCSFCGKPQNLCPHLVAGNNVYICEECARLCVQIFEDQPKEDQ